MTSTHTTRISLVTAPLLISLTGHRDLIPEHIPHLESAVRQVFTALLARCPATRLILLSQLAEGADQLVVRVAAEMKLTILGVLPMPLELYRSDFDTPDSLQRFEQSVALCSAIIQHPVPPPHTHNDAFTSGPARDACYAAAGAWTLTHSHLLLALWDGAPAGGAGGTGEIVQYMLSGPPLDFRPGDSPIDNPRVGPVIQIVTPRKINPSPPNPFSVRWLFPQTYLIHGPHAFEKLLRQIDQFNRDVSPAASSAESQDLDVLSLIEKRHAAVDQIAIGMKRRSAVAVALTTFFGLFALGFRALDTQDTMRARDFTGFALFFAAAVIVYAIAKNRQWHRRFLDYRSLAEALRVSYFWRLAGIPSRVYENYLRSQRDELVWLRSTMAAWAVTDQTLAPPPPVDSLTRLNDVHQRWIRGQLDFFSRHALARKSQAALLSAIQTLFIAIGLAQTVVSLLMGTWGNVPRFSGDLFRTLTPAAKLFTVLPILFIAASAATFAMALRRRATAVSKSRFGFIPLLLPLIVAPAAVCFAWTSPPAARSFFLILSDAVAVISPIIAATLHTYATHHAFGEESRHYGRMQLMFHAADIALARYLAEGRLSDAQSLIETLGRESITENGDWLITHRDRPVTLARP
ncbi:MAG TPA: hypothetical protein VMD30_06130 [Tepidisphaeraceae bacterium]|nr:hypothetical protein [Tepidisphaeraceae bacterium]